MFSETKALYASNKTTIIAASICTLVGFSYGAFVKKAGAGGITAWTFGGFATGIILAIAINNIAGND